LIRRRKLLFGLALIAALAVSHTASANITALDPQVQPGSSTTVGQAIIEVPANFTSATAAERAYGGTGAPSPMGVGCEPDVGPGPPAYCTATEPTTLEGFPTHGHAYGILSSGNVGRFGVPVDPENDPFDADTFDFLNQITDPSSDRGAAEDYTVLSLAVAVPAGANCLSLDYRFLSEEYPDYVGSQYNDAFIAEIGSTTWTVDAGDGALTRPGDFAASPAGNAVSVNGAGPTAMFPSESSDTYMNAATGLVTTKAPITPGNHSIHLSIFDANDSALDSAVFLDRLRFITESPTTCQPPLGLNPAPGAQPSNQFSPPGSSVVLKTKGGSGTLTFTVPGPGTMTLGQAGPGLSAARGATISAKKKKGKKKQALVAPTSATATQAGPLQVPFRLSKAGKKALKGKKGKGLKVSVKATFTPVGGTPASQVLSVKVK
jgi:hypothetical protein